MHALCDFPANTHGASSTRHSTPRCETRRRFYMHSEYVIILLQTTRRKKVELTGDICVRKVQSQTLNFHFPISQYPSILCRFYDSIFPILSPHITPFSDVDAQISKLDYANISNNTSNHKYLTSPQVSYEPHLFNYKIKALNYLSEYTRRARFHKQKARRIESRTKWVFTVRFNIPRVLTKVVKR
ncbi:hypothetical protein PUN28_013658 [Cardiocondyla obscurior]|uniref:Uncharacterized protein n=1 Tax=Cardiocondyla obscurior TaxID=286306 RepID=A0AAW2F7L2_9HYME